MQLSVYRFVDTFYLVPEIAKYIELLPRRTNYILLVFFFNFYSRQDTL